MRNQTPPVLAVHSRFGSLTTSHHPSLSFFSSPPTHFPSFFKLIYICVSLPWRLLQWACFLPDTLKCEFELSELICWCKEVIIYILSPPVCSCFIFQSAGSCTSLITTWEVRILQELFFNEYSDIHTFKSTLSLYQQKHVFFNSSLTWLFCICYKTI